MRHIAIPLLLIMILAACGPLPFGSPVPTEPPTSEPDQVNVPGMQATPGVESLPTPTLTIDTPTPEPTHTPLFALGGNGATATPIPAQTDAVNNQKIIIFLVLIGDNGYQGDQIGCADSLVPVEIAVAPYALAIQAALTALLRIEQRDYSGLYNGLYLSELSLTSISTQGDRATVRLSGQVITGGVCDDPRIIAQIKKTVLYQNPELREITILVNGRLLEEVLSLKGK